MSIAERRRTLVDKKSKLYANLSLGTAFVLLGQLSTYPALMRGCWLMLGLSALATNWQLITAIVGSLANADRLHKSKVQQLGSLATFSFTLPVILFLFGAFI